MKLTVLCLFAALTAGAQGTTEHLPVADGRASERPGLRDLWPTRLLANFWQNGFLMTSPQEGVLADRVRRRLLPKHCSRSAIRYNGLGRPLLGMRVHVSR